MEGAQGSFVAARCARHGDGQGGPSIMHTRIIFGTALTALLIASSAQAEPAAKAPEDSGTTESDWRNTAPARAVELSWATGYSQAFGNFSSDGRSVDDVAGPGTSLALGVGYRLTPR